jgi:hypothetical protein
MTTTPPAARPPLRTRPRGARRGAGRRAGAVGRAGPHDPGPRGSQRRRWSAAGEGGSLAGADPVDRDHPDGGAPPVGRLAGGVAHDRRVRHGHGPDRRVGRAALERDQWPLQPLPATRPTERCDHRERDEHAGTGRHDRAPPADEQEQPDPGEDDACRRRARRTPRGAADRAGPPQATAPRGPSPDDHEVGDAGQHALADAGHAPQVTDGGEGALGLAGVDDALGQHGADARQRLEFGGGGPVEVEPALGVDRARPGGGEQAPRPPRCI